MEGLPHRTCFGNDVTAPFVREERRGENAGRLLVNGHDSDFDPAVRVGVPPRV